MNFTIVETKSTTVTAAFLPVDTFTGDPVSEGLIVKLGDAARPPYYHPEGYVLFSDVADGQYSVDVMSPIYSLFEPVSVDTTTLDPKASVVVLPLSPRPDYIFPENTTLLRAVITDQGSVPICGARVEVTTNGYETFALTDDAGRAVLFFDLQQNSKNLSVTISKSGYDSVTQNETINQSVEENFTAQLSLSTPPAIATLDGVITNTNGYRVSQMLVDAAAYGVTGTTNAFGQVLVSPVFAQTNETVDLSAVQDGYAQNDFQVIGTKGAVTNFSEVMTISTTSNTTRVRVRAKRGSMDLEDALIEIIQKGRAAYSIADGKIEQYFEDVPSGSGGEFVDIRASKPGYVTKMINKKIKRGHNHNFTIDLPQC